MTKKNLIAEANRLYKALKKADKGGESFAKDAYKYLDRIVKGAGKRTFNTRNLSKSQREFFAMSAQKFLSYSTSVLENAKHTQSKRDMAFDNIVRRNYYYKGENLELYREAVKRLDASGYFEEMGTSPIWDDIIRDVNDWADNTDNKLMINSMRGLDDYLRELITQRIDKDSAWDFYQQDNEPAYIYNNITGEIVKKGDENYASLYQMVTIKSLFK